jgi:hypothetical protein
MGGIAELFSVFITQALAGPLYGLLVVRAASATMLYLVLGFLTRSFC